MMSTLLSHFMFATRQVKLVHLASNPTLVMMADKDTLLLKQGWCTSAVAWVG